jgi:hypothetical protein
MSFSLFRKTLASLTQFYEEYGETGLELSLLGHIISNCILYVPFADTVSHVYCKSRRRICYIEDILHWYLNPCCPRSNHNFTHFIWNSFAFYFIGYAIALVPCTTSVKVMFLCHYSARSNSHNSRWCGAYIKMFEGVQWRIEVQEVQNILK